MSNSEHTRSSCSIPGYEFTELTGAWTVDDVIRCCPASIVALNELGIDTCCGGDATLDAAAKSAGVSTAHLLDSLLTAASQNDGDNARRETCT